MILRHINVSGTGLALLRPVHLDPDLIGQPLPCDLYSEAGVLLASAGMQVTDAAFFRRLVSRPLYQQSTSDTESMQLLQRLRDIARHTAILLAGPEQGKSEEELRLLARAFVTLFRIDPDACLGYPRLEPVAPNFLNHSLQVLFVSVLLADQMDFSEAQTESLAAAALTMNMSDIPLHEHLSNQSGYVTSENWIKLKVHPDEAASMLKRIGVTDQDWLENVRQHHENMDGSGYPDSLAGAQISLAARILHVADVYCTKINARHYRPPKSTRSAARELFGAERANIDTQIASLLMRRIGLHPPGTLVRLANREHACITRLGRNGHIRFAVSFLDARGRILDSPRERNLETRVFALRHLVNFDPAWPKISWNLLWGY